ncbi:MAG TPA: fibronectin type III domain-containing protein [Thermoanaerobaculia bacterium]|nr:fibronectin type III domain-containing protein [Thermoanaerobaculia bacterium]
MSPIDCRRASLAAALGGVLLCSSAALAATPPSGTVSNSSPQATWTGGPMTPTAASTCGGPSSSSCDNYKLTIVPPSYSFKVEITLAVQATDDYDLEVYGPDGSMVGHSGNSAGQAEKVILANPAAGTYTVSASPFAPVGPYNGSAKLSQLPPPPVPSTATPPRYTNYTPPNGMGQSAGEPSIGCNRDTGKVMYIAGTETLRVSFDDCSSPASVKWENTSALWTSVTTFDPILDTDQKLGRTWVSQLLPSKMSLMAYSDDDGASWLPSQGSGINSGVDHQTIGSGPFAPGVLKAAASYPHIVYYCSQDIAMAQCATSLDGGRTFGPAVPIYTLTQCGGIHGHVKVAPDGTAYVPNRSCGSGQGMAVTTDNGLTWTVKTVPGSSSGSWDPSLGIAADGTLYFGWLNGDGHPWIAVSHDHGDTWTNIQDVGTALGIQNIAFPAVVAGDPDRAAFAFLGTTATGDVGGVDPNFPAVWHLYISHTYDGGASWVTVDATPNDPVQRGAICDQGTTCSAARNLLDFIDATVDAHGRVLVGYADGCVGSCVSGGPNSGTDVATIARQTTGKGLYAAYDVPVSIPAAPAVQAATLANGTVHLTWSTPDDHGTPLTGYHIYRKAAGGVFEQIMGVDANTNSYDDTPPAGTTYTYQVTAVNAMGEGPACREVAPTAAPPPTLTCSAPGAKVIDDPAGDSQVAALDVQSLSIAEPPTTDGSHKIVFTLKVTNLSTFTAGNAWMILWNRPVPDATYDRNYVVMRATGLNTAAFKVGKLSPPSVNQGTDLGNAVGSFSADGTITFTITTDQVDNVATGQDLSALEVRTFAANVSGQPSAQASSADHTSSATYTLVGSSQCH